MRAIRQLGCGLLLLTGVLGCDDDLPVATLIEDTRMLGSRIEVVGDEDRSTPHPGETARVTYALAAPRPGVKAGRIHSLLIQCTFPDRYTGIPICQEFLDLLEGDPDALGAELGSSTQRLRFKCKADEQIGFGGVAMACIEGAPVIEVPVSDDFKRPAKLVRGVVCDGGTPYFDASDPALFGCDGGDKTIPMFDSIAIAYDGSQDNVNPDPEAVSFQVNGRNWRAVELDMDRLDEDHCSEWARAEGLPRLDPFDHRIRISVSRDTMEPVASGCEKLDIEAFATAGEIGRRYTLFDDGDCNEDSDKPLRDTLTWTGTDIERPNLDGTLVDFFFTLRDRRGGFTLVKRTACIFTLKAAG